MTSTVSPTRENRLARETSPYLLQHKNNPVDWWPWGPAALAEAQRTGKPILLSVGYAACHWCHVMAHESFENEVTAQVMNDLFVNIKVDREERPDIDQIYMSALHHLGEHGGWPLTMFLTPSGEPVWGGTYFPPTARYGRPAFTDVLKEVARLFKEEPGRIDHNRASLMARLAENATAANPTDVGPQQMDDLARSIGTALDPVNGGLRGAPKFPQCSMLEFLWRAGRRKNDVRFFDLVELTLRHICDGGIYDHLGGGFARYSVDAKWLVPHFEKMLYDNAQLLELLALAYARSGRDLFRERAQETVAWIAREMTTREGAFCASLDADSEGEEGKFYVWTLAEITETLGHEDGEFFAKHYGATAEGNFEGRNILNRSIRASYDEGVEQHLASLRSRLLAVRDTRVRPGLDDKVLADWNGLMIAALVNAAESFGEPSWHEMAIRAFQFIAREMTRQGRLGHSWRDGRLSYPGLASDFAAMIRAALALYEASGEAPYLEQALAWQSALDRYYADADGGGYYLAAGDAQDLVVRPMSTQDDAMPNHNGLIGQNLARLALFTGDGTWRSRADKLFDGLLPLAAGNLFAHLSLLNALDLRLRAAEIVVTGRSDSTAALTAAALKLPFLDRIVVRATETDALPPSHPAREKIVAAPQGAAFVCVRETCSRPVTEPDRLATVVEHMQR